MSEYNSDFSMPSDEDQVAALGIVAWSQSYDFWNIFAEKNGGFCSKYC
jgi:hypothetical protein